MNESIAKRELTERTWDRNRTLWGPFEWGGLLCPLAVEQEMLNFLGRASIANSLAVVAENWWVKEHQLRRQIEVDQAAIGQDRQIADLKVETGYAKLAIEQATDEYVLAADFYGAKVRALLMGAQEYAAAVELKMLAVAGAETQLAIDKEALHLETVQANIIKESVNQAFVATEIAKNQLEAKKEVVRAAEAEVAAAEAEVRAEEARVSVAMATAEKAGLQADVAKLLVQVLMVKLEALKLDVGVQEIVAGFGWLQSRMDDMIQQYDTGLLIENIKTGAEQAIARTLPQILSIKGQLLDEDLTYFTQELNKKTATEELLEAAMMRVYKGMQRISTHRAVIIRDIS